MSSIKLFAITSLLVCIYSFVPISAADTPDIAEGLYRNALSLLNQGLAEQALADFTKIVNLYPSSEYADDAYYLIGKHYFQVLDYEKSLEALNMVINSYGNLDWAPAAYYLKAKIFLDSRYDKFDNKVAYANFSRIFSIYQDSDWVDRGYFGAGLATMNLLDYDKAHELFQHVAEEFPDSEFAPQARYHQGLCFVMTGDIVWALQSLQKVIDFYPSSDYAVLAKGLNTLIYKTYFAPAQGQRYNYKQVSTFSLASFKFDDAENIAIDSQGNMTIANSGEGAFYSFDVEGKLLKKKKMPHKISSLHYNIVDELVRGTNTTVLVGDKAIKLAFIKKNEKEPLEKIKRVIVDKEYNLFVVDSKFGLIQYERGRTKVKKVWPSSSVKGVEDIDHDLEGYIYFINDGIDAVMKYKNDGTEVGRIPRDGTQYKMKSMNRLALDTIGNIYILDSKTPAIFIFSKELQFIQHIQLSKKPVDFDVNYRGEIFVLNSKEKTVKKYL
ncbi:tetratricopeptide repeat protein [candidate division CSSED10-310 bacterium]|uniref:Tetratricopeptide repeat protein n=1 Tax=candidate division CSSED10-310 bacterium TaxID=2855610 RepID=A0ABV6Z3X8_UNCC1